MEWRIHSAVLPFRRVTAAAAAFSSPFSSSFFPSTRGLVEELLLQFPDFPPQWRVLVSFSNSLTENIDGPFVISSVILYCGVLRDVMERCELWCHLGVNGRAYRSRGRNGQR